MNAPHTKNTNEEQKIHPFLFLILIFSIGLVIMKSWDVWEEKMSRQQLQDVIRSDDIEILLSGGAFSKENSMPDLFEQTRQGIEDGFPKNPLKTQPLAQNDAKPDSVKEILTTFEGLEKQDIQSTSKKELSNNENSSISDVPDHSQDTVNLALRDIFISQGADGVENWRLKAEWATLRQTTSVLSLSQPSLLYRTGEQNKLNVKSVNGKTKIDPTLQPVKITEIANITRKNNENSVNKTTGDEDSSQERFFNNSKNMLLITARKGLIFDNNTKIHLAEDVLAKQNDNYAQGDTLNYDDATKIATFPDFANFASENIKGNALVLNWDMNKNQLIGEGGIEMTWYPSKKENP